MTLWLNKSRHNGYPRLAFWVPPELWLNHLLFEKDTQDNIEPGQLWDRMAYWVPLNAIFWQSAQKLWLNDG